MFATALAGSRHYPFRYQYDADDAMLLSCNMTRFVR